MMEKSLLTELVPLAESRNPVEWGFIAFNPPLFSSLASYLICEMS